MRPIADAASAGGPRFAAADRLAGIAYAGIGFGLIYAGLDQGNRLDWLNSGVVTGLLLAGGMLVVAFIMHEARAEYPLIHLSVLVRPNIAVAALLIMIYPGFGTTGASFVLPDYLTRVQGLRALQISTGSRCRNSCWCRSSRYC